MLHAFPGGHPLHITIAKTGGSTQGVRMVDKSLARDGHRFKPAVRVGGKTGNGTPVVHAPTILNRKILTQVAATEGCGRPHLGVAEGVKVFMVDAEDEGVAGLPRKTKWADAEDVGHGVWCFGDGY